MSRYALALLALVTGCGGAAKMPAPTMTTKGGSPPSLSVLEKDDPAGTPTGGACQDGWILSSLGHQGSFVRAARDDKGTWHVIYLVDHVENGVTFTGLRYLSSADPAHASSIAWSPEASIAIDKMGVPTVFFQDWPTSGVSVSRARLVGGAWQIDAKPIFDDPAAAAQKLQGVFQAIFPSFDAANHAHVGIDEPGHPTLVSDVSGSWVATDIVAATKSMGGNVVLNGSICDAAGTDFVDFGGPWSGSYVASNADGMWHTDPFVEGGWLRIDPGSGDAHTFLAKDDGLHDIDLTKGATSDHVIMAPFTPTFQVMDFAIGLKGDVSILGFDSTASQPKISVLSNGGGKWASTQLQLPPGTGGFNLLLALDADERPHLVDTTTTSAPPSPLLLQLLDPCP